MAPRPPSRAEREEKKKKTKKNRSSIPTVNLPAADIRVYLAQCSASLLQGDAAAAAILAKKAHNLARGMGEGELACLSLLGESHIELGDLDSARTYFLRAAQLDPDGKGNDPRPTHMQQQQEDALLHGGGGPETFLWLAQLSPDGGEDSVSWFEKGAEALRRQIGILENMPPPPTTATTAAKEAAAIAAATQAEEKRRKLCQALCAVAEVYMTDLSWEEDAENRCEALVTEATMVCPSSAEALQTLANVRISQARVEDARTALRMSMEIWNGGLDKEGQEAEQNAEEEEEEEEEDNDKVPEFPTRVSLARLLIEVDMIEEAVVVLNRMQLEDDESIEVAYLGGWSRYLWGNKIKEKEEGEGEGEGKAKGKEEKEWQSHWKTGRRWLTRCLKLYQKTEYEDEQLGQHATELVEDITKVLGPMKEGEEEEEDEDGEDEDGWEDADDSDEEMT